MWHVALLLFGLLNPPLLQARFFSEGGTYVQQPPSAVIDDQDSLSRIVDELRVLREAQQQQQYPSKYDQISVPLNDPENSFADNEYIGEADPAEFTQIGRDLQQIVQQQDEQGQFLPQSQPEQGLSPVIEQREPLTAQKKGQYEFVEFIEPHAKALKNVEMLDKRAPVSLTEAREGNVLHLFSNSGNVLFIAMVTMCCVASVVGVVGGAYYFNTVRKQRAEAFDDFTRYSPAGPGRDMLRKGRGFAGSPVTESGDESLAYKAQLHHYQQTKQKIIGDEGLNQDDKSDDEADDLEEHNFSVYECPGLAPTGDIEVENPNFTQQP